MLGELRYIELYITPEFYKKVYPLLHEFVFYKKHKYKIFIPEIVDHSQHFAFYQDLVLQKFVEYGRDSIPEETLYDRIESLYLVFIDIHKEELYFD
jgi:hypothetical protein